MTFKIKELYLQNNSFETMKNGNRVVESEKLEDHVLDDFPCLYSIEEAKAIVLERGRAIMAGSVKMIPHEEVMREMEQLIASYAD